MSMQLLVIEGLGLAGITALWWLSNRVRRTVVEPVLVPIPVKVIPRRPYRP
jgi:hypothetical protein